MSVALSFALTIEQVPIDQLRPDPANPRRISDEELDALERSIRQFGFVQPVLARRQDGTVIGGHQRLIAARRLGLATVPVIWLDISVNQARLLNLALNKIGGSFDDQLLARLLADLQASPEVDLSLSGFGEGEVRDLLRSLETREKAERPESFDLDAALEEATRTPRTKPGELWALRSSQDVAATAVRLAELDGLPPAPPADQETFSGRTAEPVADLVEPAKADALEKIGEGRQALGIAAGWVRGKLAPRADITTDVAPHHGP
jgi:ParB-like chromosome segregation protein Spo0J